MKKNTYQIVITEKLQKIITIQARSKAEAVRKAQQKYNNEIIILDYSDHIQTTIK